MVNLKCSGMLLARANLFPCWIYPTQKTNGKGVFSELLHSRGKKIIHTNLSVDKLLMYQLMKLSLEIAQ